MAYIIDPDTCPTTKSRAAAEYLNLLRETCVGRDVLPEALHRDLGARLTSPERAVRAGALHCVHREIGPAFLDRVTGGAGTGVTGGAGTGVTGGAGTGVTGGQH